MFSKILQEIQAGKEGRNSCIPMGFERMSTHIGIRRKIMTMIYGATGSGKSAMAHECYILNPFDWYIANKYTSKIKMRVILFSFERSKIYTVSKWLSRKIFRDTGILIPIAKMLGWWPDNKLTLDEHDLIEQYEDYINELCEFCVIIEGASNPTGYYKYIKNHAEANGKIEDIDEHHRIYLPNNEYEVVVPIVDHMGLTKTEKGYVTKKEAIDKLSEYCQISRDLYGYSPVLIAQLTRELGNVQYQKMAEFEPNIDQIKESGTPAEAADVILSLFDPLRYNTGDMGGYEPKQFINQENGNKHFRSVKIQKNTYGQDQVRYGMAFHGPTGIFKELPKKDNLTQDNIQDILSGKYFRYKEKMEYGKKPFSGFSKATESAMETVNKIVS